MKDFEQKLRNQRGVSLVELLIVIALIVVVSTLALMQFRTPSIQLKRQNVAQELKSAFERARFDSVKRRATGSAQASVVVAPNSFTLKTDIDRDGNIETDEDRVNTSWDAAISIRQQSGPISPSVTVTFNQRGEITSTGDTAFLVCNGNCSTSTSGNSSLVIVTATGTVNLLPGGNAVPTFSPPSVSNVSTVANINPNVSLP
jgi:prepilin-type N-terminal cleavage/methylation domain-containing protein